MRLCFKAFIYISPNIIHIKKGFRNKNLNPSFIIVLF